MSKSLSFTLALLSSSAFAAPVTINLSLLDGQQPFAYQTPLKLKNGQSLSVNEVKLYVSNVALIKADGSEVPISGLNLAKLSKAAAPQNVEIFKGDAPIGEYRGLRFEIGVPRDLNHRDASTAKAPLSVEDGMYWAWNSGYIFLSVLGKTILNGGEQDVALHVGGDNHRLTVNQADLQKPGTAFTLSEAGKSLPVTLNLAALLSEGLGGEAWDLAQPKYRQVHMGPLADQLAKNAQGAVK